MKICRTGRAAFATTCLALIFGVMMAAGCGFAGTVTQGTETHIGLRALDGVFVFGVTLAGFDATQDNVDNLVALARKQKAVFDAASGQ